MLIIEREEKFSLISYTLKAPKFLLNMKRDQLPNQGADFRIFEIECFLTQSLLSQSQTRYIQHPVRLLSISLLLQQIQANMSQKKKLTLYKQIFPIDSKNLFQTSKIVFINMKNHLSLFPMTIKDPNFNNPCETKLKE